LINDNFFSIRPNYIFISTSVFFYYHFFSFFIYNEFITIFICMYLKIHSFLIFRWIYSYFSAIFIYYKLLAKIINNNFFLFSICIFYIHFSFFIHKYLRLFFLLFKNTIWYQLFNSIFAFKVFISFIISFY